MWDSSCFFKISDVARKWWVRTYWVKYFDMSQWAMLTASIIFIEAIICIAFPFSCSCKRARTSGWQSWDICRCSLVPCIPSRRWGAEGSDGGGLGASGGTHRGSQCTFAFLLAKAVVSVCRVTNDQKAISSLEDSVILTPRHCFSFFCFCF